MTVTVSQEGFRVRRVSFFINIFLYLGATYHFRFRHCHSVTRGFPREKGIFYIYIYFFFFRKVHITSVSVIVTVSQEGFRVKGIFFIYIYFFI